MSSLFLLYFSLVKGAFLQDFWLGMLDFKKGKKHKSEEASEELMPVAWHPNRWWDWCMSEDEKKEIDSMFIEELKKCVLVEYSWALLTHFGTKSCIFFLV